MFEYSSRHKLEETEFETIQLDDLINKEEKGIYENKRKELENKNENLSIYQYYKVEAQKREELEKVFKEIKTKIKLNNIEEKHFYLSEKSEKINILPDILYNIKVGKSKNSCIVYNEKNRTKLLEIETGINSVLFVEKLENKDMIFIFDNEVDYILLVYRLKKGEKSGKKEYFLTQIIFESIEGFKVKTKRKKRYNSVKNETIKYDLFYTKGISRNRFFCISNYGFKLYSMNNKKEYELILVEPYEKIDIIYEIDTNKFIFGSNLRSVEGFGFCGNAYTVYKKLILDLIELKDIDKQEKKHIENLDNLQDLKEKSYISQKMFVLNHSSPLVYEKDKDLSFSDFVILKKKFFIIMIKKYILIFNLEIGKEIKKFKIILDKSYKNDIKKWDCPENDEFILISNNYVFLFKLIEENSSKVSLNILNYAYFPKLCPIYDSNGYKMTVKADIKKIKGIKNRFYSYNDYSREILIY